MDRPGARFLGADREIGLQPQQAVSLADQAVEARLGKTKGLKELKLFCFVQHGQFRIDLGRNDDRVGAVSGGAGGDQIGQLIALVGRIFVDIGDIEGGQGGQQLQHVPGLAVFLADLGRPGGLPGIQLGQSQIHQLQV